MKWVRLWWRQPDQYRWLSGYLGSRGLLRFTRTIVATIVAFFGLVPIVMLWSPSGPQGRVGAVVAITMSVVCAAMAALWMIRWPTPRQSALFAVGANACVTAGCVVAGSPVTGLLACTTFAPVAGYVALFHSSRLLVFTLTNAGLVTIGSAVRMAHSGDLALALGHLVAITIAVLAVPFAGQVLLNLLTLDALMSHADPLTGLRNRRGFERSALEMTAAAGSAPSFTVVMVDLDAFKRINDSHGHAVGDRILIAVAENLRRASRANSVVARVGGEEFLIAETTDGDTARETAESMLAAVASTPWRVTASVGVASVTTLLSDDDDATLRVIDHLIEAADAAMYEAKRAGGNQIRYSGAPVSRLR
ncbi:GGDEF domain-containing protein [soil metagenome]